jgi:hypothetical protein
LPSRESAIPHGLFPTRSTVFSTRRDARSTTATDPSRPFETKARDPSGATTTPMGLTPSLPVASWPTAACVRASTNWSAPPTSAVTNACLPSGLKATARGRGAVGMRATTPPSDVAMTSTALAASLVT